MSASIQLVVADDHPAVLRGTCEMIEEASDMVVAATASDGEQALAAAERLRPDVVLLDIKMPKLDGIGVVKALRERGYDRGILMLSAADEEGPILESLQAGANGFLLKTATEEELHQAIRLVAGGEAALLQPSVQKAMLSSVRRREEPLVEPLSAREIEILRTLAKDMSNKEIAKQLNISDRTVQQHLSNIFGKLGVASRTGAVLRALNEGWLKLEDTRP